VPGFLRSVIAVDNLHRDPVELAREFREGLGRPADVYLEYEYVFRLIRPDDGTSPKRRASSSPLPAA
jgi:hypothetical protein